MFGNATITDNVKLTGAVMVYYGNAYIGGNATVCYTAKIKDHVIITDKSEIVDGSKLIGNMKIDNKIVSYISIQDIPIVCTASSVADFC